MDWYAVQRALKAAGFPPGPIDGIPGSKTRKALNAFKAKHRLPQDGAYDPKVLALLGIQQPKLISPPWIGILYAHKGLRESGMSKDELVAFLKSDGSTIGDPAKFPWCGDAVQTPMLLAGYDPTPSNPWLARNWLTYGRSIKPGYGAIGVFSRPGPNGNEGHVGFLVGISGDAKRYRVLGGNQANMITDNSWVLASRLLGARAPADWLTQLSPLPVLGEDGAFLSKDEA